MRSLCTCAALAVATAFAHGHFADARLRSGEVQKRESDITDKVFNAFESDCLEKINTFRTGLFKGAAKYVQDDEVVSEENTRNDLTAFLTDINCGDLESGKFAHLGNGHGSASMFVITAKKEKADEENTCDFAIKQWQQGFSAFKSKHPPKYKDFSEDQGEDNPYANPDAAALASLLQEEQQKVVCGTLGSCGVGVVCYFKPSGIEKDVIPVDPLLWHRLEAQQSLKPKLEEATAADGEDSLKAVNEARKAVGLENPFTDPAAKKSVRRGKRSNEPDDVNKTVQEFLYKLTCDDISQPNVSPAQPDGDFTVIYYVKDVKKTKAADGGPTLEEAVEYWKGGFQKLQYKRPPAFKKEALQAKTGVEAGDPAVEASKIYKDSAVAGYVSIMTDEPRTMACVAVTGCEKPAELQQPDATSSAKSGLICVVQKATLEEGKQPISKKTWSKIMEKHGYPLPNFKRLEEAKNCLEEMNAVRTQEKLGLKPFLVKPAAAKSDTELVLSDVMESVTCQAIGGAAAETTKSTGPEFKITDGTTSLMYHTGTENTCSEAVEAWKKGQEKFSAAPPAYTATEEVYKDAAATNFASLISDGGSTTATCYSTGCTKDGIVCELSPAALVEGKKPVSNETWTKYAEKDTETSGVAGVSKAALIGTVVMTLAAGVFFL